MRVWMTERLRLEPMAARHAEDLLALYQDPAVAEWYGEWTRAGIEQEVARMAERWAVDGVHKWMAYDRVSGERVGRGGLSRAYVDGRVCLEVGWVVHRRFWGLGYASEIGRAGLDFAFGELGAREVVAFTEPANVRSQAVMRRLHMRYRKEIFIAGERFVLYAVGPLVPETRIERP